MKTDDLIVFGGVTHVFGGLFDRQKVKAVDGVSFAVRRGEVFGLLGPPNSGKSTVLKLLSGVLEPAQGEIKLGGLPLRSSPVAALVGYLPAGFTLDARLPCVEVLSDQPGLAPAQRLKRTQEIFEFIGFPGALQKNFGELPLEAQRCISIARALALNLEVLLLDDPLAGLDEPAGGRVRELIRKFARAGKTLVISVRWLPDAADTCDRVAVFHAGRVLAQGTVPEIFTTPDALQIIGPVLPPDMEQRALDLIRQEICDCKDSATTPVTAMETARTPLPKTEAASDDKLARLAPKHPAVNSPEAATPEKAAADELARANEKLASLLTVPRRPHGG